MKFEKGKSPWNKGKKMSLEQRDKLSKIKIGKKPSLETRKKMSEAHKVKINPNFKCDWNGRKHSEEAKRKMSIAAKGKIISEETRRKISEILKGKKHKDNGKTHLSIAVRKNLSNKLKGENAPNWKGGLTGINFKIRHGIEHRLWREAVFARDNWTCQNKECKERGGELQAHHIQSFSKYTELRFAIDNGVTLCKRCHKKTDNYGNKKKK
jgi:hypothetical protein